MSLTGTGDDGDAEVFDACMGALDAAGLFVLVDEETGPRRLLPRPVVEALSEWRGTMGALREWAAGGELDAGIVGRHRDVWDAATRWTLDAEDDEQGHGFGDDATGEVDDREGRALHPADIERLVMAADNASDEARRDWGLFMLAVGVAAGMAYAQRGTETGPWSAAVTNMAGVAADWCDAQAEREELGRQHQTA